MKPYLPRLISRQDTLTVDGWDLKRYSITLPGSPIEPARFDEARRLAISALPAPASTAQRLGVGFLVEHQGDGVDYCVLGWWDRENELPLRVFVAEPGAAWRPARGSESVCVWDLEVIAAERAAYIATVLSSKPGDGRATYLGFVSPLPG
jgi:hypothetical protein